MVIMMTLRVGMVSLGCPKNQVDAEMILAQFAEAGYEITGDAGLADIVIVNTCGFIEDAKTESIENILEFCTLKAEGRIKRVVVTGCLAERYRDEVAKEIPEADVIAGIGCNHQLVALVEESLGKEGQLCRYGAKEALPLSGNRVLTTLPFFAYVKIAEGCDNCCSYCAIPAIRGRYRSRAKEEILEEAEKLAKGGVTELVLVAQDTTRYGEDLYENYRLADLLEELAKIPGLHWIRTLYNYPERITDKLIDTVAAHENLVPYFDIPIQHCCDEILARMNRRGDRAMIEDVVKRIRAKIPHATLRTTLIAGFPGETKGQFGELARFVQEMKFDRLGCFAYSPEEGTPAAELPGQVPDEEKRRRADIIMDEQMTVLERKQQKLVGKTLEVVVEGYDRYAECFFGRSAMDAPDIDTKVFFDAPKGLQMKLGSYVKVKMNEMVEGDLMGELAEE